MGCLNNDRTVMSKAFAWRPLALLPILKASACRETDKDWLVNRRLDLYHRSMDHVDFCKKVATLTSARRWRPAPTIRMCSCAFYDIMFAKVICDIFKNCKRIWPVKMTVRQCRPLIARNIGLLETTPFHVNLVFDILCCRPFFQDVKSTRVSW